MTSLKDIFILHEGAIKQSKWVKYMWKTQHTFLVYPYPSDD